jgi:hypothetical protein
MISHSEVRERLSYDSETGYLHWIKLPASAKTVKLGDRAGFTHGKGYRGIEIFGKSYKEHRLIWFWWHGRWPTAYIDHINGDRADNRIANLREAEHGQNRANSRANQNTITGLKGITFNKLWGRKKFRAGITFQNKRILIGYFTTAQEAHEAYCNVAQKLHGAFFHS